ncbi:TPA: mercuric transport protein [Citrobacter freundii]|nr:mercuric transport protein [Citrobacter freundii]HAT7610299.1 mercuric transport protein [Citrobacter freundii]
MNDRLKPEPPEQEPVSSLPAVLIVFGLLSCCLMPTILGTLSLLGSWLSALPALEAYRSSLLVPITAVLFLAWRRLYRPSQACDLDNGCTSQPKSDLFYKISFWIIAIGYARVFAYPYLVNVFP